jgi:DNA invertase Pin-like site-specific DNA recombinase
MLSYRYDRFARSLRQLVNALEEFRSLGIEFISLHEGVDTSTPNGRLVFGIFASIAEFERELIRDRVKSGIAAVRSKGRRLGRPKVRWMPPGLLLYAILALHGARSIDNNWG